MKIAAAQAHFSKIPSLLQPNTRPPEAGRNSQIECTQLSRLEARKKVLPLAGGSIPGFGEDMDLGAWVFHTNTPSPSSIEAEAPLRRWLGLERSDPARVEEIWGVKLEPEPVIGRVLKCYATSLPASHRQNVGEKTWKPHRFADCSAILLK